MIQVVAIYYMSMNLISFIVTCIDKRKAVKNKWRVRERTLFILAFAGGALGIYVAMHLIHHKTRHFAFSVGMPIMIFVNIIMIWWVVNL